MLLPLLLFWQVERQLNIEMKQKEWWSNACENPYLYVHQSLNSSQHSFFIRRGAIFVTKNFATTSSERSLPPDKKQFFGSSNAYA
jgi:hypothetical protein